MRQKNIPSVNLGHQASFKSSLTPRPAVKSITGEWILKNYARAKPIHRDFIFNLTMISFLLLLLRRKYWNQHHSMVTMSPSISPLIANRNWSTFFIHSATFGLRSSAHRPSRIKSYNNISLLPVDRHLFTKSLVGCSGIITGGGFETPAEALHLGKKLMTIPITNHYEQQCNAVALEQLGVTKLKKIDRDFCW